MALLKDPTQMQKKEPSDRPDIVARVLIRKMEHILKDVRGACLAKWWMVYMLNFKKRGLPH